MFKESRILFRGPEKQPSSESTKKHQESEPPRPIDFADIYELFNTNSVLGSGIAAKAVEETKLLIAEKQKEGKQLIEINGIYWHWQNKEGIISSEVIPAAKQNKVYLQPKHKKSLEENEKHMENLKRNEIEKHKEAYRKKERAKKIGEAGIKVADIYEQILQQNDWEKVQLLDQIQLDSLLRKGFTRIEPLYNGTGKKTVGYVMVNEKTEEEKVFDMITPYSPLATHSRTPAAEANPEKDTDSELTPEREAEMDEYFAEQIRRKEEMKAIQEERFGEEKEYYDGLMEDLEDGEHKAPGYYDENREDMNAKRQKLAEGIPGIDEVNQYITELETSLQEKIGEISQHGEEYETPEDFNQAIQDALSEIKEEHNSEEMGKTFSALREEHKDDPEIAAQLDLYGTAIYTQFEAQLDGQKEEIPKDEEDEGIPIPPIPEDDW